METIIKLVNFLQLTSAVQHCFLQNFCFEINADYTDLLVHNNVRWLSKGRVLEQFWLIKKEIMVFLEDQSSVKSKAFLTFLRDDKQMEIVGFLTNIMSHLNDLNVKLQGKQHTIFDLITTIHSFQKKFRIFKFDVQNNFFYFPKLLEQCRAVFLNMGLRIFEMGLKFSLGLH